MRNVLAVSLLLTAVWPAAGQTVPPPAEIIASVLEATSPSHALQVDVIQTITTANGNKGQDAIEPARFSLAWEPEKQAFCPVAAPSAKAGDAAPPLRMSVDLPRFLAEMEAWPGLEAEAETLDERPGFRVSGQSPSGGMACTLWVDAEQRCVVRLSLDVQGNRFADATFDYVKGPEGEWLPARSVVDHAADGSRVVQEYSNYRMTED